MGAREPTDIAELAKECVMQLAPVAAQKHQQISFENGSGASALVQAYPVLLGALLRNLVENSIRYCPESAQIVLSVCRDADHVWIVVEDDGPGVPAEVMPSLATRFFRHERADSSGSGLGLSIVARVVQIHEATLEFSSVVPHGLRVRVGLPLPKLAG